MAGGESRVNACTLALVNKKYRGFRKEGPGRKPFCKRVFPLAVCLTLIHLDTLKDLSLMERSAVSIGLYLRYRA